jgi:Domain of Unknown Function with PDB structure (DUF3857)/Transglutaminase-like superfamily
MIRLVIAFLILVASPCFSAAPQPAKVLTGPPPKWVLSPLAPETSDPPKDALLQVRYVDNEIRVSKSGQESYISQKFKILRPEALQLANLRFVWQPANGQLTVHSVTLHRKDGSVADMLKGAQFQIVQREESLEQSVLTGLTTAVLTIPGVDVGDEVEFSATIKDRDPTLVNEAFGALQMPMLDLNGVFRSRLISSESFAINRRISPDLDNAGFIVVKSPTELTIRMTNPVSFNPPDGSPGRFHVGRFIEFSTFPSWLEVSKVFWTHFDRASKLLPASPLKAEIAKMAASTNDPEARALAALRLVQNRTRYVFVGFGTGNYSPATAEETWSRRYGDCKGKTALLLAILRELGIDAEAVLVNQSGLEGIETRLASPSLFDHVLVRATIGKKTYWLDGTQFNSPDLRYVPQPAFRTALPLRASGAELESVVATQLDRPKLVDITDIDATAGAKMPVRLHVRRLMQGIEASQLRPALALLSGEDLKQALRGIIGYGNAAIEAESSNWTYDEPTGVLTLNWSATQKLDWESDSLGEEEFFIPGAGFTPPDELNRSKGQDQSAPWKLDFPSFKCWVTTIHLPPNQGRLRWTYNSKPVNRTFGGVQYYRQATIRNGYMQTIMSRRGTKAELSAADAKIMNAGLPDFDNAKSMLYRTRVGPDEGNSDDTRMLVESKGIDWISAGTICLPPQGK